MGLEARGPGSQGPRGFGLSHFPNPRGGCWAEASGGVGWGFELAAVPEGSCPSSPSPGPAVTAPHSPAGSKESLFSCTLTASEEAMAVLEEVILYAFQQCVYYVSKVRPLRARSPGGPACRPGRLCPPGPRPRAPGPLTCRCSRRASPLPQAGPASERDGAGCSGEASRTAGQLCGGSGCRGPGSPARAVPNAGGGSRAAMSRDSEPSGGPRGSAVSLGQWGSLAPTPSSKTLLIK